MRRSGWFALLFVLLLPAPSSALERYPTANRLGISVGFGFGSASLDSLHSYVDDLTSYIQRTQGVTVSPPKSNFQINSEIAFRYYFPYYILGHIGVDAVYNRASTPLGGTASFNTDQLSMELPILVGGYYPFFGRLIAFGAIGPSPFVYNRSWTSTDPGGHTVLNTRADTGCGFHFATGAEFLVTRALALGLELRYRYLKTGDLIGTDSGAVITTGFLRGDGSTGTYNLDLSGVSFGITIRVLAM